MKHLFTALLIVFCFQNIWSQFGPGGVGNVSNNGLWLRADQIEGLNNGDNVALWEDQSGNGNNAANGTAAEQPQYYNTSALNNRPVVRFDGSHQMIVPDANILDGSPGMTYFSVLRRNGNGGPEGICGKRITFTVSVEYAYTFFFWSGQRLYLDVHTNNNRFNTTNTFTANNNYMPSFVYDGSLVASQRSKIYNAGNLLRTANESSTSLPNSNQDLCIGALNVNYGTYLDADMAELIHYNFALNSAQRIIVENYLGAKYNMVIANNYFNYNLSHGNEVAGIGREDASNFHDDSQGSSFVRINTPSSLNDGDYLIWGHDNGDMTNNNIADVDGAIIQSRLNRVWRLAETGDVGTVRIVFDISSFSTYNIADVRLLIDRNGNGFFDNDVMPITGTSLGGGVIEFTGIDFQDGDFFTIGSINSTLTPLPVELLDFEALNQDNDVLTKWITASEKNVSHFEVLRSKDAIKWEMVGQTPAAGNSNSELNYRWLDETPLSGVSYYKLKSVDFDGSYSLSQIESVNRTTEERKFIIYPNPAKDFVHISSTQSLDDVEVMIYDASSRPVNVNVLEREGSEMVIDVSLLTKGMYVLVMKTNLKTQTERLILL